MGLSDCYCSETRYVPVTVPDLLHLQHSEAHAIPRLSVPNPLDIMVPSPHRFDRVWRSDRNRKWRIQGSCSLRQRMARSIEKYDELN